MPGWLTEGAAQRSASRIAPVIHLLVHDSGDRLWCSGGPGVPWTPIRAEGIRPRLCGECRSLAREAVADSTLEPDDLQADWL